MAEPTTDDSQPARRGPTRRRLLTYIGAAAGAGVLAGVVDQVESAHAMPVNLPPRQPVKLTDQAQIVPLSPRYFPTSRFQPLIQSGSDVVAQSSPNEASGGTLNLGAPSDGHDVVHVFEFDFGPTNTRATQPTFSKTRALFQLSNEASLQLTVDAGNLSLRSLPVMGDSRAITTLTNLADPAIFNGTLRLAIVRSVMNPPVMLAYARGPKSRDVLLGAWKTSGDSTALNFYNLGDNTSQQFDLRVKGASTAQVEWQSRSVQGQNGYTGVTDALLSGNDTFFGIPQLSPGFTGQIREIRYALDAAFPAPTIGQTISG